jgi:hypothetical protein
MPDPWANDPIINPASTAPQPLIPRTPAPQTAPQAHGDVLANQKTEQQIRAEKANADIAEHKASEEAGIDQKQAAAKLSAIESADQLIGAVHRARSLVSGWSTGIGGAVLDHVPASQAAQLDTVVNQEIRGNIFLNRVNALKEENPSPTGGTGIGRIMQAEIPLITGSIGALDPVKMGRQGTLDSLDQIEARTLRTKAIINGENPDDPAVQKKYHIPALPTYGAGSPPPAVGTNPPGGGTPPGGGSPPDAPPPVDLQMNADTPYATRAAEYRDALYQATAAHKFKTVADMQAFATQYNQQHGTNFGLPDDTPQSRRALANANKGKAFNVEMPADPAVKKEVNRRLKNRSGGTDAAVVGAATDIPFINHIAAAADAGAKFVVGQGNLADNYNTSLDATHGYEEALRGRHPLPYIGGQLGGALALPAGELRTPGALAKVGAAYGAAYGFDQGDPNASPGQRFADTATGAIAGGATGYAIPRGFEFIKGLRAKGAADAVNAYPKEEIGQAMIDEGIPGGRPIADPSKRGDMAYLETTRGGHAQVRDSLEKTRSTIADKVEAIPSGEAQSAGTMGETIQGAGSRRITAQKRLAGRVYDQAATAAGDARVVPKEGLATLDNYIEQLGRNPNANRGTLAYLKSVRGDLANADGPLSKTVADIRDIRTGMADEINRRNLGQTRAEFIMGDVLKSLKGDIGRDLSAAKPDALSLYGKADDMWSAMSKDRQQIVEKLIGPADNPISGEAAMGRVQNMMKGGDAKRFTRVMNMMTPKERGDFGATLFENIGQRSPEEPFSPATFLANTKGMSSDALTTVFGPDAAKSVTNLRLASKGFTDASKSLNQSRSGFVANFKDIVSSVTNLRGAAGAGVGFAAGGLPGAVVGAVATEGVQRAASYFSAKSLMNPNVSQWIRAVSTVKTESAARKLIARLPKLAAINPELREPIQALMSRIANDNVPQIGTAAASPDQRPAQQQ